MIKSESPSKTVLITSSIEFIKERANSCLPVVDVEVHTIAQQWSNLRNAISAAGASPVVIKADNASKTALDLVGTAGLLFGGRFLPAANKFDSLMGQEGYFTEWIDNMGVSVFNYTKDRAYSAFGGGVDIAYDASTDIVWFGYGRSSDKKFLETLYEFFDLSDVDVMSLEITDTSTNSLDECFAPLQNGKVIVKPAAFSNAALRAIKMVYGADLICVNDKKVNCSGIVVNEFFLHEKNALLAKLVEQAGLTPIQVDISALTRGRCGLKRLVLDSIE